MRLSHIGWNLAGLSLPLLVAVVTVPHLISKLGNERFGLLALAWGLIGYAGALDLGIGRALTQMVSRMRSANNKAEIPSAINTAARITLIVGIVGGGVIALLSTLEVQNWIKLSQVSSTELRNSILMLAIALPAQAMSATYRGVNDAFLNFKGVSLLRVALGAINFGGPYLVANYSTNLSMLIATLVVSRLFALWVYRVLAFRCVENYEIKRDTSHFSPKIAKQLFSFGGWLTLSNVLNPLIGQADRFFIAYLVSAAAVTSYVIPYEIAAQSLIVMGAVTTVAFPYFAGLTRDGSRTAEKLLFKLSISFFLLMMIAAVVLVNIFPLIIRVWLPNSVSLNFQKIFLVLSFGLAPYAVGTLCVSYLHAKGLFKLTGLLNLIEFPIFALIIFLAISHYGVYGAAWAWVARVTIDASLMALLAANKK